MGKLLNINVLMLVYVQNCKRVQSLISHPTITFLQSADRIIMDKIKGNTNTETLYIIQKIYLSSRFNTKNAFKIEKKI